MIIKKTTIGTLSKCYSLAQLNYRGKQHFLVAAEQNDKCLLFDGAGNLVDTIWEEPGGVMSMQQIPGTNGAFLAIHQFYSPNDSKQSKIVHVMPDENGTWIIKTVVVQPHVHRFDILEREGVRYLIVCTLKSGHEYADDWSAPGKVYVAKLPEDWSDYNQNHQLELSVIKDNMLKNHGYTRAVEGDVQTAVISCESGVYQFYPPKKKEKIWQINQLIKTPASDAVLVDLNEDGKPELAVISPFHGNKISIYEKKDDVYREAYVYGASAPFSHSIYGGDFCEKKRVVIGHREGERCLICFSWDKENGYSYQVMDQGTGSANIMKLFKAGEEDILVSTNREIDEIAMYECKSEEEL